MEHKRITLQDIARRLNTTPATVSRALQNHPRIGDAMKKAVNALATELNYHPDSVAQNLRTGRGSVIGVIVPRIDRNFFASVIGEIEREAGKAGYSVLIAQSNESYSNECAAVRAMLSKKVDALAVSLAAGTINYDHFNPFFQKKIPLVFFDRIPESLEVNKIMIDNYALAYQAVTSLIEQGCRRIMHLAGPQTLNVYRDRLEGYKQALVDYNIAFDASLVREAITLETGRAVALDLLASGTLPDALFAAGDYSAIGAMHAFKKAGVSVPEQLAIVGFANEPFCEFVDPSLSSVDQCERLLGKQVAELLIEEMEMDEICRKPQTIALNAKLVIRASSQRKVH